MSSSTSSSGVGVGVGIGRASRCHASLATSCSPSPVSVCSSLRQLHTQQQVVGEEKWKALRELTREIQTQRATLKELRQQEKNNTQTIQTNNKEIQTLEKEKEQAYANKQQQDKENKLSIHRDKEWTAFMHEKNMQAQKEKKEKERVTAELQQGSADRQEELNNKIKGMNDMSMSGKVILLPEWLDETAEQQQQTEQMIDDINLFLQYTLEGYCNKCLMNRSSKHDQQQQGHLNGCVLAPAPPAVAKKSWSVEDDPDMSSYTQ